MVHRYTWGNCKNAAASPYTSPCPLAPTDAPMFSVAAIHSDAKAIDATLCENVALNPLHEAIA